VPFALHDSSCGIFFGHRSSRIKFEQAELSFLTLLAGQLAYQIIMSRIISGLTKEINALSKTSSSSSLRNQELQAVTQCLLRKIERVSADTADALLNGPLQSGLDLSRWLKCLERECFADTGKTERDRPYAGTGRGFKLRAACRDQSAVSFCFAGFGAAARRKIIMPKNNAQRGFADPAGTHSNR
jgi:hypothetical protein